MWSYIFRRLVQSIFVLFGLSIVIFVIARIVPGDPARMALGPRAPEFAVENLRQEMNLDKPLFTQYRLWLVGITKGDWGLSLTTRRPVSADIKEFLPATFEVVLLGAVFMVLGGISLGIWSAQSTGRWRDGLMRVISYLGIVTPAFVWAIIFMLLFGFKIRIFPVVGRLTNEAAAPPTVTGMMVLDSLLAKKFDVAWDAFLHLVLPAASLCMGGMAQAARITRTSMVDNINRDYVSSLLAYGVPTKQIFQKHLLRPSLIPTVSVMALDIATMFANGFLVESLFNYPGLSRYGTQAMLNKDLNAISGVIMVLGVIFVITNIAIDVILGYLDPRVGLSRRRA